MTFEAWWAKRKGEVGEAGYVAERWARRAWAAAKRDEAKKAVRQKAADSLKGIWAGLPKSAAKELMKKTY